MTFNRIREGGDALHRPLPFFTSLSKGIEYETHWVVKTPIPFGIKFGFPTWQDFFNESQFFIASPNCYLTVLLRAFYLFFFIVDTHSRVQQDAHDNAQDSILSQHSFDPGEGGQSMSPPAFQLSSDGFEEETATAAPLQLMEAGDGFTGVTPPEDSGGGGGGGGGANPPNDSQPNDTGLPDDLKSGIENLSGYSMDDVNVHYNSNKPVQLQAHAYAQGSDIHVAPGQEKHLPHEAWHVVQQKQGRVQPTTQLKQDVAINDDHGLENEADVMGAKAMQLKSISGSDSLQQVSAPGNAPVQGMFEWSFLVDLLGTLAFYFLMELGSAAFYSIIRACYRRGARTREEVVDALNQARDEVGLEDEDNANQENENVNQSEDSNDNLLQEVQEVEEDLGKVDVSPEDVNQKINESDQIPDLVPDEVQNLNSSSKGNSSQDSNSVVESSEQLNSSNNSSEQNTKEEVQEEVKEEKQNASSRGETYLNALRNTNMWGGYAEANAIATNLGFTSRIYGNVGGQLRLLANIGNGTARNLSLYWSGNHYQVIQGNFNNGDNIPNILHNPNGDGNCMFEAMFVIMRMGTQHTRALMQDDRRRELEISNMRNMAADVLEEGDPALLNYLGEEMHQARKKADLSQWKNVVGAKAIDNMELHEKLLMASYKAYPPKEYFIDSSSKSYYFVKRDDDTTRVKISTFLRDNESVTQALADESGSAKIRKDFENWLGFEASYRVKKKGSQEAAIPKGFDKHSFKVSDSAGILAFLEDKVSSSKNLENCSQHLDGMSGRTTMTYNEAVVYHYSRGRDQWGQQYSVFYTVLDDDFLFVKVVGVGSHVGSGSASYKLAWGIGDDSWVNNYQFSL